MLAGCRDRWSGTLLAVFVGDEEVASAGARHYAASKPEIDFAVVGEPTSNGTVIAHKGSLRPLVRVNGVAAHSGTPDLGDNAIYRAARLIGLIEEHHANIVRRRSHPLVGAASLTVTRIRGGVADNVVPDRVELLLDRRMVPGETEAEAMAEIEALLRTARDRFGVKAEVVEYRQTTGGASQTAADEAIVQASLAACRRHGARFPARSAFPAPAISCTSTRSVRRAWWSGRDRWTSRTSRTSSCRSTSSSPRASSIATSRLPCWARPPDGDPALPASLRNPSHDSSGVDRPRPRVGLPACRIRAPRRECPLKAAAERHRRARRDRAGEHLLSDRAADARLLRLPGAGPAGRGRGDLRDPAARSLQFRRQHVHLRLRSLPGRRRSGRHPDRRPAEAGPGRPADRHREARLVPPRRVLRGPAVAHRRDQRRFRARSRACAR